MRSITSGVVLMNKMCCTYTVNNNDNVYDYNQFCVADEWCIIIIFGGYPKKLFLSVFYSIPAEICDKLHLRGRAGK